VGLFLNPASAWVQRWLHPASGLLAHGAKVLDVACGSGRHVHWLAGHGYAVSAVDRDAAALQGLQPLATLVQADIENDPWPFAQQRFDAVLVTNYLWRPLWPALLAALAPGAVLVYETFAQGQQHIGKPSRPDFLLAPGELLRLCAGLRVVAFEDGYEAAPERYVQRIVAVNEINQSSSHVPRYSLVNRASNGPVLPS
jgi:SAM-dependent methyltransferase